ncbi:MAG: hypothetical protein KDK34_24300 [Leptospiraceae bacterium]|nr:hypothetical protein [Leptospiraceae bacterium]
MIRIRYSAFIKLLVRPDVIGFNLAALAVLFLSIPELIILLFNNGRNVPDAGRLFALCLAVMVALAVAYAALFQFFFVGVRVLAALVSHAERVWPPMVPGLVVFLLLGEPMQVFVTLPTDPGIITAVIRFGLFLLVSFGVGVLLVYIFPFFRGRNAAFILIAAIIVRLFLLPVNPVDSNLARFFLFEMNVFICSFLIFVVIQARYRIQLIPDFDSIRVPRTLIPIGIAFCVFTAIVMILNAVPLEKPGVVSENTLPLHVLALSGLDYRTGIPVALYCLCFIQSTASLVWIRNLSGVRMSDLLSRIQRHLYYSAILLTLFATSIVVLINWSRPRQLAHLVSAGGLSAESLRLIGFILDGDGDGNSWWPGHDPDDSDPCTRVDFLERCAAAGENTAQRNQAIANDSSEESESTERTGLTDATRVMSVPVIPARPAFRPLHEYNGKRSVFLITLQNTPDAWIYSEPALFSRRLFLPADDSLHALRAIFRNQTGVHEYRNQRAVSLFSSLADHGYRTLCINRGHPDFFRPDNRLHMDAGCQVYTHIAVQSRQEPKSTQETQAVQNVRESSEARQVGETERNHLHGLVAESLQMYRKYREDATITWIHFDFAGAANPGGLTAQDWPDILKKLTERGRVLVVAFQENHVLAHMASFGTEDLHAHLPAYPDLYDVVLRTCGVYNGSIRSTDKSVGVIYNQPYSRSWVRRYAESLYLSYARHPIFTFRMFDGQLLINDVLTGAHWQRPVH